MWRAWSRMESAPATPYTVAAVARSWVISGFIGEQGSHSGEEADSSRKDAFALPVIPVPSPPRRERDRGQRPRAAVGRADREARDQRGLRLHGCLAGGGEHEPHPSVARAHD